MFYIAHKWTAETIRLRTEQDAVDSAFRSDDVSLLSAVSAATLVRSAQTYSEAAIYQRGLCADAAARPGFEEIPGVSEWISATEELATRQESFAAKLRELAPLPQDQPSPMGKSTVNSVA